MSDVPVRMQTWHLSIPYGEWNEDKDVPRASLAGATATAIQWAKSRKADVLVYTADWQYVGVALRDGRFHTTESLRLTQREDSAFTTVTSALRRWWPVRR